MWQHCVGLLYHDSQWLVARVEFLQEISPKRDEFAKSLAEPKRNDINVPHAELGHPATGTAMGLNLTGMFKQKRVA